MERRTVALRDEDWRVLYETAVYLTMQRGRSVSLAKAGKVVFAVLRQQDWFRKHSDALVKELDALIKKEKEAAHAKDGRLTGGAGSDRVTPGG